MGRGIRQALGWLVIIAACAAAQPPACATNVTLPGQVCGVMSGARLDWAADGGLGLEREAVAAYQAMLDASLRAPCGAVAGRAASCEDCLRAYRSLVCARHVPCLAQVDAAEGACASRCSVAAKPCDSLCSSVARTCPFGLAQSVRCPEDAGSLVQTPGARVAVRPASPQELAGAAGAWPGSRWGQDGCFGGWSD